MKQRELKSHYPSFDVLRAQEEWDSNTRNIVLSRLELRHDWKFLHDAERELLKAIASCLLAEERRDITTFVVAQLDDYLASDKGESQREQGLPPGPELIRHGLECLNLAAQQQKEQSSISLLELSRTEQRALLAQMQDGQLLVGANWSDKQQKALFSKLLTRMSKAYYSHPTIWSEIGYAGPAYPRGYVRSEYGLTDPWEARRHEK